VTRAVRTVTIVNREGLHARPVMKFIDLAGTFASTVRLSKVTGPQRHPQPGGTAGEVVDGKSPMEMLLLEAPLGSCLQIVAEGADAEQAVEALAKLIGEGFGEELG
jgi:phosphocarrier protein